MKHKSVVKHLLPVCLCTALVLLCLLGIAVNANAATIVDSGTCGENLNWTLDSDGTLTISGTGEMEDYDWNSPFDSDMSIQNIVIEDGVTSIGEHAFSQCSTLMSITIPDSVTSIGSMAFFECLRINAVYISDIVAWCNIDFDSSPLEYGEYGVNLYLNQVLVTDLVIPDGVTSIGGYSFVNCDSLTSITIPDGVNTIGSHAFEYCSSLTSITIPDSVTSIGGGAFYNCSSLTSITIPYGVATIENATFYGCSSLTSITIPDSVTSIGYSAFEDCDSLTGLYISDITAWCNIDFWDSDSNPLYHAKNLYLNDELVTELVIPDSVTSIRSYAFYNCSSLTSITIPDSVTTIGHAAFCGCSSLTSITIPDGVTSIGASAFSGCSSLTSITIPESVTSIGYSVFSRCSSLTGITIPESVTSIDDYAFYYCGSLTSITIPDRVTSIGASAFSGCSSLGSVTIGDSVTSICKEVFYNCSSLVGVTIGNCVTSIGDRAFSNCDRLTDIIIPDGVTTIGYYAFYDCDSLESVTLPLSLKEVENYAFVGPSIGYQSSLKDVYYAGTQDNWNHIEIAIYNGYLTAANIHYKHIHDFSIIDPKIVAPTCTEAGYSIYTCSMGDQHRLDYVAPLRHEVGNKTTVIKPTCTEAGYSLTTCQRCGTEYQFDAKNALGHSFTGPVNVGLAPTCELDGWEGKSCTRCEIIREDSVISATGHTIVRIEKKEPTCTEAGSEGGTCCKTCGVIFVQPTTTGPKLGHSFTSYTSNNNATCSADETETAKCDRCDETNTRTVAGSALGHKVSNGVCVVCNKVLIGITVQPKNSIVKNGDTAIFSTKATGNKLTYKWQYRTSSSGSWVNAKATGNTTATLSVPASVSRHGYQYRCRVTDGEGNTLYTDVATLNVLGIKTQPANKTVKDGVTAKFTVSAVGKSIKYQWQYRTSSSGSWKTAKASGNTTKTLSVSATTSKHGYQYRCRVTDSAGNKVYTKAVTLNVLGIKTQPVNKTVVSGKTAKFTVTATGKSLKYQWQYRSSSSGSWKNTSATGNTTKTLSVPASVSRHGYQYRCKITDSAGNVIYTNTVNLYVLGIKTQPVSETVKVGATAKFTVKATGKGLTYQWQYKTPDGSWKNVSASSGKKATYSLNAAARHNGYRYRCKITDSAGNVIYTNTVKLTVK